ncbi:MAG: SMC-Scp complex subunit ScpB [Lachnospiraceae bacterium]|nr:SMC-Scp complex subunit ScpB [Lachnospiraceae bacterium]
MDKKEMESVVEGILFAMGDSVETEKIANALEAPVEDIEEVLESLSNKYEKENRGIRLTKLEGAYQMSTSPDIYEYLIKLAKQPKKYALTDVLLETLSIIAYKQPITKAEIEKIRGVSSDHAVSKLVEYSLVQELGRLDAPGKPMLFGTTEEFLRSFAITSISDLPVLNPVQVEEFKIQAEAEVNAALAENKENDGLLD